MLNLHSTEGLFWMKEWVSPRVSTATRSIPLKAPLALEIKSAPASSAILKSCNLPRGAPPSSVSRFRPQKKWITSASWLVPLLHVFLLYTAMASEEQPAAFSQGARLRDLLRRALSSVDPSEALADAAKKGGVQVIAVDFDMTMIRLHSGKCKSQLTVFNSSFLFLFSSSYEALSRHADGCFEQSPRNDFFVGCFLSGCVNSKSHSGRLVFAHAGGNTSNTPGNPIFTALSRDFDLFATAANSRGIKIAVVTFGGE